MPNKLTTEEFIEKARKVHGDKYDYSKVEYKGSQIKVCIICPKHGEFWQMPTNHLMGQGCYKCSKISMANKQRISEDDMRERLSNIFGDLYDLSKLNYKDYKHKVTLVCKEHGEFSLMPSNLMKGHGCPICGNKRKGISKMMSQKKFEELAFNIHKGRYDYSLVDVHKRDESGRIPIICPIHGKFWQTISNHIYGKQGCPKCKSSKLEQKLINFFDEEDIEYIHQKRFCWLGIQKLDFYLPKYNIAIECQGEQHYIGSNFGSKKITDDESLELVKKRDACKLDLCEKNGVKLLYFSDKKYEDNIITDEKMLLEVIKTSTFQN